MIIMVLITISRMIKKTMTVIMMITVKMVMMITKMIILIMIKDNGSNDNNNWRLIEHNINSIKYY